MLDARRRDKTAVLVRDKLYVNNRLYKPSSLSAEADASKITVITLNIGTPRPATVVVLNIKQFNFTLK